MTTTIQALSEPVTPPKNRTETYDRPNSPDVYWQAAFEPARRHTEAWVQDSQLRFEMDRRPETEALLRELWRDGAPVVTYMKRGKDCRYRFAVACNRWNKVYRRLAP